MKVQVASLFKIPALELVSVENQNGSYAVRLSSPRDVDLEDVVVVIGPARAFLSAARPARCART